MLVKVVIRIGLIVVILTVLNWLYTVTTYKRDLTEKCEQAIEIPANQPTTDLFYFAESSNFSYAETDSVKASISELTQQFFPSLKITAINKAATHAGIFRAWLNLLDPALKMPRALVITLNMRSFDAAWINSSLETPLQESLVFTRPYPHLLNRFLLSLQAFDNKTEKQREHDMLDDWATTRLEFPFPAKYHTVREWDQGMANGGHVNADGSWNMPKIELACHYIKTYAFNIGPSNPRVKDFDAISAWCSEHKVPLYLNLLAENVEYADSLVGKELVFLMRRNRDWLVKRYTRPGCTVVDNLELVNGRDYTDQNWTTEHYNLRGRMNVARNLASHLQKEFKQNYKKAY